MTTPSTEKRRHPHFDDRGTLDWIPTFAEARARAQAERKLIFIEIGRELCGGCRTLVTAVVPRPDVAPLLQQHFVALAGDADLPEAEVHRLLFKLRAATLLPIVILADAQGRFLDGVSGVSDPARIRSLLEKHLSSGAAAPAPAG